MKSILFLIICFSLSCAGLSRSTHSEVECLACQRPSVLVGETLLVTVFSPSSNAESPQTPPIKIVCAGVACDVQPFDPRFSSNASDVGSSKRRVRVQYAIRPIEPGELNLSVEIASDFGGERKIIQLGRRDVLQAQEIAIQCLARSKKGILQDCEKEPSISSEDEVQIRISALDNQGVRMPGVEHKVTINGSDFPWARPGNWRCKMSAVNEDGRGAIETCYGKGLKPGKYDIRITLGVLSQEIHLIAKGKFFTEKP